MAQALTAPFLVAALILCTAGIAKLRSPATAARALVTAGLPSSTLAVRAFAAAEVCLGAWSMLAPGRVVAAALACTYAGFAGLVVLLARRAASCGCFGAGDAPASSVQSIVSAALAIVSAAAAAWPAHGLGWVLHRPPGIASGLLVGIGGAVYGTVVAYTELPLAWSSWSAR
jgi:hypothetical protein